jgi:hypothetical protein
MLGCKCDLNTCVLELLERKRVKYLGRVEAAIRCFEDHAQARMTRVDVDKLIGTLLYVASVDLNQRPRFLHLFNWRKACRHDYTQTRPSRKAYPELLHWRQVLSSPVRGSFAKAPPLCRDRFASDASNLGVGIVVVDMAHLFQFQSDWRKRERHNIGTAEAFGLEILARTVVQTI